MNNNELTTYISESIDKLIINALKSMIMNPKEITFLMKYTLSSKKAYKLRMNYQDTGVHIPAFLISSITTSCNLHCKGCYARANHMCGEVACGETLADERWGELFEEAKNIGISFILLAGGEPLLRKEVIERASKIDDVIFPIFTNGTIMDEYYINMFNKNRNLIPVISLEGNEKRTDDRRGLGTHCKINDTMSKLKKAKILYGTSITVTTENFEEVSSNEFIENLRDTDCKIVFFIEYVPITENTNHLAPTDKERLYLQQKQDELRIAYTDMIFLSFPGDEKFTGGCLAAGRGFFHINPYGGAEPCPFSPYSDCNLKENSLIDALNSPLFKKLKQMELVGGEHDGGCSLFAHEEEVKQIISGEISK
ncbi:MAG: radical SAM protein [Oscillospiraceae bacterium]